MTCVRCVVSDMRGRALAGGPESLGLMSPAESRVRRTLLKLSRDAVAPFRRLPACGLEAFISVTGYRSSLRLTLSSTRMHSENFVALGRSISPGSSKFSA